MELKVSYLDEKYESQDKLIVKYLNFMLLKHFANVRCTMVMTNGPTCYETLSNPDSEYELPYKYVCI